MKPGQTLLLYFAVFLMALATVDVTTSCRREPASQPSQTPDTQSRPTAPSGPQLPAKHLTSEIIEPGGDYHPDGGPLIQNIPVGSSAYIRPWSMWQTADGNYFVNVQHSYSTIPQPNYIKVTRLDSGFSVELCQTKFEWSAIDIKGFPKQGNYYNQPVVEIKE